MKILSSLHAAALRCKITPMWRAGRGACAHRRFSHRHEEKGGEFAEISPAAKSSQEWINTPGAENFTTDGDRWRPTGEAIVVIRVHPRPFLEEHGLESPPPIFARIARVLSHTMKNEKELASGGKGPTGD